MQRFRSHYLPRTRPGRLLLALFLGLFAFTQPPLVFWIGNRVEPLLGGLPFLYVYLLIFYCLLIGVLVWMMRREL